MTFRDKFRFVRQNMKKTKSRVFMTVLATAMACTFLIVLASVGFGLQRSIVKDVTGDRAVTEIQIHGKQKGEPLTDKDLDYLRSIPHVNAVTHRSYVQQPLMPTVSGTKETMGGGTVIVDFESEKKAGFKLAAGRLPQSADEVVVGYSFRERYMPQPEKTLEDGTKVVEERKSSDIPPAKDWISQTIEMEMTKFEGKVEKKQPLSAKIVGVAQKPTREWMKDIDIYADRSFLDRIEAFTGMLNGAVVHPDHKEVGPDGPKKVGEERTYRNVTAVADSMKNVRDIAAEMRTKGYMNHSIADELKQVNVIFTIMQVGLIFVGTIALLIASIGIYNTMTMAVTERAQDIGIMKAIGAHPSAIRSIFLIESSYIGLLGAVIGTAVAYAISAGVNILIPVIIQSFMNERVPDNFSFSYIPLSLTLLSVAISVGVAVLSGSRPAKRATRVDVLKALRRDI